jgi:hypothetical protein
MEDNAADTGPGSDNWRNTGCAPTDTRIPEPLNIYVLVVLLDDELATRMLADCSADRLASLDVLQRTRGYLSP